MQTSKPSALHNCTIAHSSTSLQLKHHLVNIIGAKSTPVFTNFMLMEKTINVIILGLPSKQT